MTDDDCSGLPLADPGIMPALGRPLVDCSAPSPRRVLRNPRSARMSLAESQVSGRRDNPSQCSSAPLPAPIFHAGACTRRAE